MYKTCIYCNRNLGDNESVENFPVGRRLAFLEERWEAIEECERQYRDTTVRYSTDNVGLARLREGLDLVRIGKPLRPEFAAWRYGREFLQRRVAVEASIALNLFVAVYDALVFYFTGGEKLRVVTRVRAEDGTHLPLSRADISDVRLVQSGAPEGWILRVPHRAGLAQRRWWSEYAGNEEETTELTGSAAVRAAGKILPKVNLYGGRDRQVQGAVNLIEDAGNAERTFRVLSQAPGYVQGALFDRDGSTRGSGTACPRRRARGAGGGLARGRGDRCHRRYALGAGRSRGVDSETSRRVGPRGPVVGGQWPVAGKFERSKLQVAGYRPPATGHRLQVAFQQHPSMVHLMAGHKVREGAYRKLVAARRAA
jgi:hypothetical protein